MSANWPLAAAGAVHHRDHRVHGEAVLDLRPVERLHERLGQREAGGFDQHVIDLAAAFHELLHHREEFFLHRAAQAAVRQFIQLAFGLDAVFVATDTATLEDFAVDTKFAELVDDHRDALAARMLKNVPQQRGLAAAEKARDDGDGNLAHLSLHREVHP
ncbi:hypothetical protein GGD41_004332 [Paraburkholderia bryophila]|uniref:Uncharacterized protein n=1 Tax=Paraburkholderia bryophila TaxID=420952 RepID=A0A7Z0B0X4_9BURK|nr:hypothetical protein [Paraburkholderia bryophila]